MGGLDPGDRLGLGDRALVDHVGRDPDGGRRGSLRAARLEHVQPTALDREFEVLHVAVVRLELLADALELGIDLGHLGLHLGDLGGRPDAGDDVLALGIGQVLAEEHLLAGVRVAGEGHARTRVVAHVAEDHRHDIDRRAEVVRDVLVLAVVLGALAEPAGEDRLDREVELLVRIVGEVAAGIGLDDRLEVRDEIAQRGGVEVGVLLDAVFGLGRLERVVEALPADLHDDPAEHLDEPSVGVPAEPLVAGQLDQADQRLLVEPEVEDGVHHPGHRELRPRTNADQQRVRGVTEALARACLHLADGLEDVLPQTVRQPLAGGEVVVAGLGRDREARGRREAGLGHLGEPGTLAAEQVAHRRVAVRAAVAPRVDVALGGLVGAIRGRGRGLGHRVVLRGRGGGRAW